ncbi:MAG: BolA/IbaG family iron-sulfur metabolism protein [Myxococcota bacterium]
MPLQILSSPSDPPEDLVPQLEKAVREVFPDAATVEVTANSPGHFSVRVVCASFADQNRVKQQQRVYGAIAHLMAGDAAPVHAIDRLITETP